MTDSSEGLTQDYREAGFNRRLGMGEHPALLVVDMCRAYFDPDSPLYAEMAGVAEACTRLVAAARDQGFPVIWTRVEYEPGGQDGGVFYRKVGALSVFDRGGPLGEWLRDLTPEQGEVVVTKQYASAFFATSLAATLTSTGIDTTVVCGVSTSGCVRATATDASAAGFLPFVVREAVGDRTPHIEDANLFDLHAKYADVVAMADVVSYLESIRSGGTDR